MGSSAKKVIHEQPPELFSKKRVLKNFAEFTENSQA